MSARERFWKIICPYSPYFYIMLVFMTVIGFLNLAAVVLAEQSEETFVVSVIVFVLVAIAIVPLVFVLWRCKKRRPQK